MEKEMEKELKRNWKGNEKEMGEKKSPYHDSQQQGIEKDLKRNWKGIEKEMEKEQFLPWFSPTRNWKGIEKEMGKETFLPWLPPTTPHPVPVSCACLKRKLQRNVSTMIATNNTTSSTVSCACLKRKLHHRNLHSLIWVLPRSRVLV